MRTALKTMENNRSHMTYVIKLSRDMTNTHAAFIAVFHGPTLSSTGGYERKSSNYECANLSEGKLPINKTMIDF